MLGEEVDISTASKRADILECMLLPYMLLPCMLSSKHVPRRGLSASSTAESYCGLQDALYTNRLILQDFHLLCFVGNDALTLDQGVLFRLLALTVHHSQPGKIMQFLSSPAWEG